LLSLPFLHTVSQNPLIHRAQALGDDRHFAGPRRQCLLPVKTVEVAVYSMSNRIEFHVCDSTAFTNLLISEFRDDCKIPILAA